MLTVVVTSITRRYADSKILQHPHIRKLWQLILIGVFLMVAVELSSHKLLVATIAVLFSIKSMAMERTNLNEATVRVNVGAGILRLGGSVDTKLTSRFDINYSYYEQFYLGGNIAGLKLKLNPLSDGLVYTMVAGAGRTVLYDIDGDE